MINELYTLLNNSTATSGVLAADIVDPDYSPVHLEVQAEDILSRLIGESLQSKQYWLTMIRRAFSDRFWSEPLSYFDPRTGYSLSDLQSVISRHQQLQRSSSAIFAYTSQRFWKTDEFDVLTWSLSISSSEAQISVVRPPYTQLTKEFDAAGAVSFPVNEDVNLMIKAGSASGTLKWASVPTESLRDRVHTIQAEAISSLSYFATADSRFPSLLRSGLLDLALCTADTFRAAAAMLLLVGGSLAKGYDAAK